MSANNLNEWRQFRRSPANQAHVRQAHAMGQKFGREKVTLVAPRFTGTARRVAGELGVELRRPDEFPQEAV